MNYVLQLQQEKKEIWDSRAIRAPGLDSSFIHYLPLIQDQITAAADYVQYSSNIFQLLLGIWAI